MIHALRLLILGLVLVLGAGSVTGCALGAAAGAGYVAGDEIEEDDGKFDPGEEIIDYD